MPTPGRRAPSHARASTPETRLRKRAQSFTTKALKTLAQLMQDAGAPATIRLAAARELLDRGHGRPTLGLADAPEGGGMTVILKRYSDVTEEEEARAAEGEP